MYIKLKIECEDIGIDYADEGEWRNYRLCTEGNSYKECMDNAWIEECDQDGGTLREYQLNDSEKEIYNAGKECIMRFSKINGRLFEYLLEERKELCQLFEQSKTEEYKNLLRSQLKNNNDQINEFLNDNT